jgi:hypothetical protein
MSHADVEQAPGARGHERSQELSAELEAALLRQLMISWRDINESFFHGLLRKPVLRLTTHRSLLGRYHHDERTLELSRPMVLTSPWIAVLEVLKHEMAHQYVREVLGVTDESPHGQAFRDTCSRLGIDARASGPPPEGATSPSGDSDRNEVLRRRVAALLALAESPNRHEAENAAAQAQRLMLKHNIALSARPERLAYGYRQLGVPKGRVPESEHLLAAILTEYFFVEAIWIASYRPLDGTRGSVLEICGTHENLELAG